MRILILLVLLLFGCMHADEYSRDVHYVPKIVYKGYYGNEPVWGHDTNGDGKIDYCAQYTYDDGLKEIGRWKSKDGRTCNQ
jgi:hypothetical protein